MNRIVIVLALALSFFSSCEKIEVDDVKPTIDLSVTGAFPLNCDTLYLGEPFVFKAQLSDNVELGSYGVEIHHNFDHHAHTTEISSCDLSTVKTPVNPFHYIADFEIPSNTSDYVTADTIIIPVTNASGKIDEGDYHFYVSLVDREGWTTKKGLSVKILKR